MYKYKIRKVHIVLFFVLLVLIYAVKFREYKTDSFVELESFIKMNKDLSSEFGEIEEIEIIKFNKGMSEKGSSVMYRVNIEGKEKEQKLFFYLSNKTGIWKVNKYGVKP